MVKSLQNTLLPVWCFFCGLFFCLSSVIPERCIEGLFLEAQRVNAEIDGRLVWDSL